MEKDTVGRMAMDNGIKFDYYYGKEADQFSFYRIPRLLIKDERFKGLSNDAKLLYGLMLDRLALSIKNGWFGNSIISTILSSGDKPDSIIPHLSSKRRYLLFTS